MRYYQRERIDRPYRIMIVVIGIAKFLSMVLGSCPVDAKQMGVNDCRMIVVRRGTRMNVFKRSYQKCQQEREACL